MIDAQEVWLLLAKKAGVASWSKLYPVAAGASTDSFVTDSGTATPENGDLGIGGNLSFETYAIGDTLEIFTDESLTVLNNMTVSFSWLKSGGSFTSASLTTTNGIVCSNVSTSGEIITVAAGGADIATSVDLQSLGVGVVQSNATGVLSSDNGTNGQALIGGTAITPVWASIASADGSIDITETANGIDLSQDGGAIGPSGQEYTFLYYASEPETGSSSFFIGSQKKLIKDYDPSNMFFPGDSAGTGAKFTAPIDGVYHIHATVSRADAGPQTSYSQVKIISPTSYCLMLEPPLYYRNLRQNRTRIYSSVFDNMYVLTAGQEVTFQVLVTGGPVAISKNTSPIQGLRTTWISGHLIR